MTTITFEAVAAAAETLVAQEQKPTLANIRTVLGGGSFTTISPLLKQWRDSHIAEVATAPIADPAPPEISSRVDALASEIWQAAMSLANSRLAAERDALEQSRIAIEADREETVELANQISNDLEAVTAERDALQQALDALQVQFSESESQCQDQAEKIAEQAQAIKDAQAAATVAQARANELADLLKTEQSARSRLETEASGLHQRIEVLAGNTASLQAQVKAVEQAKADMQSTLQKQVDELQAQLKAQRTITDDLQSNLSKRDADLANAKARADYAQARLDEAERIIATAKEETEKARNDAKFSAEVAAELKGRIGELEKRLAAANQSKT